MFKRFQIKLMFSLFFMFMWSHSSYSATEVVDISGKVEKYFEQPAFNQVEDELKKYTFQKSKSKKVEKPKLNLKDVNSFVSKVLIIDEDFQQFFYNFEAAAQSMDKQDSERLIQAHLDVIRYIEKAQEKIKLLESTQETDSLKISMLNYYEQFIKFHTLSLSQIVTPDENVDMKSLIQEFSQYENDFYSQLEAFLKKNSEINVIPPQEFVKPETLVQNNLSDVTITDQELARIKEEYQFYLSQMKELVQVNEALKIQTQHLMKRNHVLQEQLHEIVEASLAHMSLEQKQALLKYLNAL